MTTILNHAIAILQNMHKVNGEAFKVLGASAKILIDEALNMNETPTTALVAPVEPDNPATALEIEPETHVLSLPEPQKPPETTQTAPANKKAKREKVDIKWWMTQIENPREDDELEYFIETRTGLLKVIGRIRESQPEDTKSLRDLVDLVNDKIDECNNASAQYLLDEASDCYTHVTEQINAGEHFFAENLFTHYATSVERILNPTNKFVASALRRVCKPTFAAVRTRLLSDVAETQRKIAIMAKEQQPA